MRQARCRPTSQREIGFSGMHCEFVQMFHVEHIVMTEVYVQIV
jgi:hypothetical protein